MVNKRRFRASLTTEERRDVPARTVPFGAGLHQPLHRVREIMVFAALDNQRRLSRNQHRLIGAATAGNVLDFFDLYLIGFVLAYIAGPWGLKFGQAAIVLSASGLGAMFGAVFWGWLADRIGRRPVFTGTSASR